MVVGDVGAGSQWVIADRLEGGGGGDVLAALRGERLVSHWSYIVDRRLRWGLGVPVGRRRPLLLCEGAWVRMGGRRVIMDDAREVTCGR